MAYIADEACQAQGMENKKRLYEFNNAKPWESENMARLIDSIFGSHGKKYDYSSAFSVRLRKKYRSRGQFLREL